MFIWQRRYPSEENRDAHTPRDKFNDRCTFMYVGLSEGCQLTFSNSLTRRDLRVIHLN